MTKTNSPKKQNFFIFSLKQNFSSLFFSLSIFLIMILIILNPAAFSKSTIAGIKLFFYSVLPGLFPFMFLTKILTEIGSVFKISKHFQKVSNKLFGTPGVSLYCFFMSILSGYPIGAKIISDLYNKNLITEEDAKRMSIFCTTSGPIFVIGAVGVGMLSSFKIGLVIYIAHILSGVICGLIYNIIFKNKNQTQIKIVLASNKTENIFSLCLNETINSLFLVGGYITIFYLFTDILDVLQIISFITSLLSPMLLKLKINPAEISGIIYGIVEVTHGAKALSLLPSPNIQAITALISFSGISIIMQSLAFLKTAKIKAHTFILSKCVQAIISFFICKLLFFFII